MELEEKTEVAMVLEEINESKDLKRLEELQKKEKDIQKLKEQLKSRLILKSKIKKDDKVLIKDKTGEYEGFVAHLSLNEINNKIYAKLLRVTASGRPSTVYYQQGDLEEIGVYSDVSVDILTKIEN